MPDGFLVIWSISLVLVILVIYGVKNGKVRLNLKKFSKNFKKSRFNYNVDQKLRSFRNKAIPPKKYVPFLPLIPFFIIVYIFMNHYVFFAVITSDSMDPEFNRGDIVLMQSVDTDVDEDDIIMFANKNPRGVHPPVIHRVVNNTHEGFKTKGDALENVDDWTVKQDEVKAKAITVFDSKPLVIKDAGGYFIQDFQTNGYEDGKFVMTSVLVAALKDLGVVVFSFCVILYIILTIKDLNGYKK